MRQKNNFNINLLSVIIPAYKQEKTIIKDIKRISKALDALEYNYEIIMVVDGIIDYTYKNASKMKSGKVKISQPELQFLQRNPEALNVRQEIHWHEPELFLFASLIFR